MSDHFADFDEQTTSSSYSSGNGGNSGSGSYSREVFSEKISAKYRTFFVDVKENDHGHLIKISEKSRGGKKSTIMMDAEDLPEIIEALKNANSFLDQDY